jgi:transcriptional regulator with XRE-family HTH domain
LTPIRRRAASYPLSFSDRLNTLFRAFLTPPDQEGRRRQWTDSEIARAARELGASGLTRQYVSQLRRGERANPSLELATILARAFEHLARAAAQPPQASAIVGYLAGTDEVARERIHEQLNSAVDLRDSMVSGVAARLGSLDARSLRSVMELIDRLQDADDTEQATGTGKRRRRRAR